MHKPKNPNKYRVMLFILALYMLAMLGMGLRDLIPWNLIIASAAPDGVAIYFGLVALQLSNTMEYKNAHVMRSLLMMNENILAYLQREVVMEDSHAPDSQG